MTDLFFRSLEDLKNRIQIQSSLGGELFLCKRMEICYNKKRDDTKREVLNMAKDERNAYTIQNDASLWLLRKWMALLPWPEILRMK